MPVTERSSRPMRAGIATLHYTLDGGQMPWADRDEREIHLPRRGLEIVPVLDGQSLVVRIYRSGRGNRDTFVGTDDNGVFASELTRPVDLRRLRTPEGEEAFLASLRPTPFQ